MVAGYWILIGIVELNAEYDLNLEGVSAFQIRRIGAAFVEERVVRRRPDAGRARVRLVNDVAVRRRRPPPFVLAVVEEVVVRPEIQRRPAVRPDRTVARHIQHCQ